MLPRSSLGPRLSSALSAAPRHAVVVPAVAARQLLFTTRSTTRTRTRTLHTTSTMATSKDAVIPQADRMFEGGTHKLDVWSIFTCVAPSPG